MYAMVVLRFPPIPEHLEHRFQLMNTHRWMMLCAAVSLVQASASAAQGHAHTHGLGQLDIGLESTTGTLLFIAPGDDLYGFEHAPRTPAEKAKQQAAFDILSKRGNELMRFDPSLGCVVTPVSVGVGGEAHKGADHNDVQAKYSVSCKKPLAGKDIRFAFTKLFPSLVTVKVQLVSETVQVGKDVVRDQGTVRP